MKRLKLNKKLVSILNVIVLYFNNNLHSKNISTEPDTVRNQIELNNSLNRNLKNLTIVVNNSWKIIDFSQWIKEVDSNQQEHIYITFINLQKGLNKINALDTFIENHQRKLSKWHIFHLFFKYEDKTKPKNLKNSLEINLNIKYLDHLEIENYDTVNILQDILISRIVLNSGTYLKPESFKYIKFITMKLMFEKSENKNILEYLNYYINNPIENYFNYSNNIKNDEIELNIYIEFKDTFSLNWFSMNSFPIFIKIKNLKYLSIHEFDILLFSSVKIILFKDEKSRIKSKLFIYSCNKNHLHYIKLLNTQQNNIKRVVYYIDSNIEIKELKLLNKKMEIILYLGHNISKKNKNQIKFFSYFRRNITINKP